MKTALGACLSSLLFLSACSATSGTPTPGRTGSGSGSGAGATGSGSGGSTGSSTGAGAGPSATGGTVSVQPGGGAGGTGDVMNGECDQVNFVSMRKPAEVLLVLDRSASMVEHEIEDGVTRWDGVVPMLNEAIQATDSAVSWGLKTFPEMSGNECEPSSVTSNIDVPIEPANAADVVAAVNATTPEGDGTPTGAAINAAVAYLKGVQNDNPKFILLATDGQPSCADLGSGGGDPPAFAIDAVTAAKNAGFPVFVVGVLDPEPSNSTLTTLNGMAIAGGKPRPIANPLAQKFYLAATKADLLAALSEITGEVATCIFPFEEAPPDETNIAVKVNGERVEQDSSHTNGWDYTSDAYLGVEVYGPLCDHIKQGNQNAIDIIFGCPGQVIK